ncbi:hypothetical protein [Comamonas terrae]|uniref:XRE family transcriptional regulator n=1 Tax=Comamonas terrae TaxID=673548 RepID=A0ABW5UPZ4_9BURK|nr:hypothetical protein [Comamonas terrae]
MIKYVPPTPEDLNRLKAQLGYSGEQMAELASVSGGQQWRKYTGGATPRDLGMHILFFMAARLVLPPEQLQAIADKMAEIGAEVDGTALAGHGQK